MRDFNLTKWLLAVLLLLVPWVADAAGLGRLTVLSSLGQPFNAEIDLVSVQKEEIATLSVRLASPEAYRKADLQYNAVTAGLRFSIERRPNGQPYIKVTTERPVNEFVVDVLVELNWASGRLMREYRALLDPPGAEPPPAHVAAPEPRPAPVAKPLAATPVPERPDAEAGSYGPIQRGETLFKIARSVRSEGVSVEQVLVGLFRGNPDAFIRKNMNLVRSGKILRVPGRGELAAIPHREAVKEYRAQVADWNAYRRKLADAAGIVPEGRTAASGQIAARVEDEVSAGTKDVVRLSKGEPPGGAVGTKDGQPVSAKERIRNLEEEVIAREKELNEAKERIAQLEKIIKDQQRRIEITSPTLAAAQQQTGTKPASKPEAAKPVPKPEVAKPAKPKPKPKAKPAPPPEPELMDIVMENLTLIAGGGAVVLGGLALWFMRRRRAPAEKADTEEKTAPTLGEGEGSSSATSATPAVVPAAPVQAQAVAAAETELDPLEEARVYLSHGRDAQAEATLKEALAKQPKREDFQVKLLEIYAARKDKAAFGRLAGDFNKLTGGQGENWLRVVAMGLALDPQNPLYSSGKDASAAAPLAAQAPAVDLDFNLDLAAPTSAATDIPLEVGGEPPAGAAKRTAEPAPEPMMYDFKLEVPPAAQTEVTQAPTPVPETIDFNIELPKIEVPETKAAGAAQPERKSDSDLDFELDLGDINLNLDDKPQDAAAAGEVKDAHWYDVQAKFDLAKAYQEMSDKAGAQEILQEVIREGDPEQQAQAKALLASLG